VIDFLDSDNSVIAPANRARRRLSLWSTPRRWCARVIGWRAASRLVEEILNTDAATYGGANNGNLGGMHAEATPWQGKGYSLMLRLPPLGLVGFKWRHGS
jgi:1,4-alpha-glucan branching enzyme